MRDLSIPAIVAAILLSSLSSSLGVGQSLYDPPRQLNGDDFASRYVGNTLSGRTPDGSEFHVHIPRAGDYLMIYQGKKSKGTWRASHAGAFCGRDDSGAEICTLEFMRGDEITSFNPDGSIAGTAVIREGNPEGL